MMNFKEAILAGIPDRLPEPKPYDLSINHAPKRKDCLTPEDKKLAILNALRYFKPEQHALLAKEFAQELADYGRIYMHRLRPDYPIYARPIEEYPYRSKAAAAIMLMIQNNLDPKVAQHPHELIIYGGNGAAFQHWAQYLLTMRYLAIMTEEQTLVLYSGHPLGLFPSNPQAPRLVITNGMMVPNYSKPEDWERFNALGVTQFGQMTAGSFMYIGPQGIVHGTTITLLNAGRKIAKHGEGLEGKVFVSSGLGGMSGAQAKAAVIAGGIAVIAEINPLVISKRHSQGWVDEVFTDLKGLIQRLEQARVSKEAVSLAYQGNVVDLWEYLVAHDVPVDLGSDQTSLHNPWAGGYYPVDLSLSESMHLMTQNPDQFKGAVQHSLLRQVKAIHQLVSKGMYFFDYGNAFLLEASRAGADVVAAEGGFKYPSYVQDIMGPMCFDYGFGPFRWVCTSGLESDLDITDALAAEVLDSIAAHAPSEIQQQLADNSRWIKLAKSNQLVVGSKARILYADAEGRMKIAEAFNEAIQSGKISAPVVLGRDHHDVSGTDSPYRETSDIVDGSQFTADMSIQNVIGDAFRGATWVSIHNGGGVGWGEVSNGGFGLVLDGTEAAGRRLKSMLFWDVNNGLARRSWARHKGALATIKRAMALEPHLVVTLPNEVEDGLIP